MVGAMTTFPQRKYTTAYFNMKESYGERNYLENKRGRFAQKSMDYEEVNK